MTTTANCILLRYEGGHVYVDESDGDPRREQYVEMRGFRDRDHAISVARQILAAGREENLTTTTSGTVRSDTQIPTHAYRIGDKIDGEMIHALTTTSSENGVVTVSPELTSRYSSRQEAISRRLQRAAAGVTGEYAAPSINSQEQGSGNDSAPPDWSLSAVVESLAPAWIATRPFWLSWVEATIEETGTGITRVTLLRELRGGTWQPHGTIALSGGVDRVVAPINIGFPVGSKLTWVVPDAATGALNLTISPRGAMV